MSVGREKVSEKNTIKIILNRTVFPFMYFIIFDERILQIANEKFTFNNFTVSPFQNFERFQFILDKEQLPCLLKTIIPD